MLSDFLDYICFEFVDCSVNAFAMNILKKNKAIYIKIMEENGSL